MTKEEAAKIHNDFFGHDVEKQMTVELFEMDNLTFLGQCYSVKYIAQKHADKKPELYEHEFENPCMLLTNGHDLLIYSPTDDIKITIRGIEG